VSHQFSRRGEATSNVRSEWTGCYTTAQSAPPAPDVALVKLHKSHCFAGALLTMPKEPLNRVKFKTLP